MHYSGLEDDVFVGTDIVQKGNRIEVVDEENVVVEEEGGGGKDEEGRKYDGTQRRVEPGLATIS